MRRVALALALSTLLAAPAAAQVPLADIRVGVHAVLPTGDLGDAYSTSFGAYARVGMPLGVAKIMGTVTVNRLKGKTVNIPPFGNVGLDDETVLGITVGPHFSPAPLFDFGIEGGYFSNFDEFGIVPSVSLSLVKFDVMGAYNIVLADPNATWLSLGVGIRF